MTTVEKLLDRPDIIQSASAETIVRIEKAAAHYGVEIEEKDWHDLGRRPHTRNASR